MTTVLITTPHGNFPERSYACEVILGRFLGLPWRLEQDDGSSVRLHVDGSDNELELPDIFFGVSVPDWRSERSLPELPLHTFQLGRCGFSSRLVTGDVPIIYGNDTDLVETKTHIRLPIDVFGSAFFMLSRYEEVVRKDRDMHDRFPASASLAYKAGHLERPIVDEYVEILWAAMHELWPGLSRHQRRGSIFYTCDVDHPYERSSKKLRTLLRATTGDLVKRGQITRALARIGNASRARLGDYSNDPNNTFDWIMDLCEANNHRAAFYFIAGHSAGAIDGCYDLNEPFIQGLMTRIHDRGHEIGMHGSYNSFREADTLGMERENLLRTFEALSIGDQGAGVRQHYLRWDSGLTPSLLEAVGFEYDTTGGFADHPGFRYGTSRPFPMWDWQGRRLLKLIQRPLIAMEVSIVEAKYLGLESTEDQISLIGRLKQACLAFGGDFCILWHNNRLSDQRARGLLTTTLSDKTSGH